MHKSFAWCSFIAHSTMLKLHGTRTEICIYIACLWTKFTEHHVESCEREQLRHWKCEYIYIFRVYNYRRDKIIKIIFVYTHRTRTDVMQILQFVYLRPNTKNDRESVNDGRHDTDKLESIWCTRLQIDIKIYNMELRTLTASFCFKI